MTLHPTSYDWRFQGEDGQTYDSGSSHLLLATRAGNESSRPEGGPARQVLARTRLVGQFEMVKQCSP